MENNEPNKTSSAKFVTGAIIIVLVVAAAVFAGSRRGGEDKVGSEPLTPPPPASVNPPAVSPVPPPVSPGAVSLKVYFPNSKLDPGTPDCAKVFSVSRTIPATRAVAKAALAELLKGPTAEELSLGYFTSINSGVRLQKLSIVSGAAKADFDEEFERNVGGSCRVTSIIAQVEETLKQFPTVQKVEISINGRTEDILQP